MPSPSLKIRIAWLAWLLLMSWSVGTPAADVALDGQWRPALPQEAAAAVHADDASLQRFDPALFQRFRSPDDQSWVLLRPQGGTWPDTPWVLGVMDAGLQTITLHVPGRTDAPKARLGHRDSGTWPGHGRIAFVIDAPIAAGEALLLHVDARGVIASSLRFVAQPAADFVKDDAAWLALASASLAVMLAMATMALCFALRLRDATFLYYAIFIGGYAFILALQSGFVFEPLGWTGLAPSLRLWGRLAVATSIAAAAMFFTRFADLPRYLRRGHRLLVAYAVLVGAIALLGLVPPLDGIGRALINPLLIVGAPLFIGIAALAAWRGSRYAGLFMLGWTPLLVVTAVSSLQLYGTHSAWTWSEQAGLLCGALEALLFSLGLAYRTLELRRAHEQARMQADIDSLTGLYNRRAWQVRVEARHIDGPLSMLFLDIDEFKRLNDRHGHHVGDDALRALARAIGSELRECDIAGRYGGEEFVVALPATDATQAVGIAERIRARMQQGTAGKPGMSPTVSIGVASSLPGEDSTLLLRRADRAMYTAKKAGRNRVALARANRHRRDIE